MSLPRPPVESTVVEVGGVEVKIRALTGSEWNHCINLQKQGKSNDAQARFISYGTDTDLDEVKQWIDDVSGGIVEDLSFHIQQITGVGPDAQFRSGTGADARGDGPV